DNELLAQISRRWLHLRDTYGVDVVREDADQAPRTREGLRVVMYDWEKAGIDWLAAALREGHGRLDEHSERFHEAWQAKRAPDRAF
ncbi:hypothetical protein AB0454_44715, partial [Streptomyces sp. NPDC093509]